MPMWHFMSATSSQSVGISASDAPLAIWVAARRDAFLASPWRP
jgi:hypothetical protein